MNLMTQVFSPYQLNPLNYNPLKDILERYADPAALQSSETTELFVAATSARTGMPVSFRAGKSTARSCWHRPVSRSCSRQWKLTVSRTGMEDMSETPLSGPVYYTDTADVLLVQINPLRRDEVPQTAYQIINRLNEITFNSSLIAEMRAINFVSKLIHENRLDTHKYRDVRMHMVAAGPKVKDLDASSKMNANWEFSLYLKEHGREQMDAWLKANKADIGKRATLDIQQTFLDKPHSSNTSKHVKPVRKAR